VVELRNAIDVPLSVMPSGVRMRSLRKSSQLFPVTAGTISPAAMYSTLSYAYRLRKLDAGFAARMRWMISARP